MSKLFIAVALCIVAATFVFAEVNPTVDLKDGVAYTAQTDRVTTVYRFKTSKAYKNSTLLVDFTRYYGWGPQVGISSLQVYRCVYSGSTLDTYYTPHCAVNNNDEDVHCRARVPACMVEPNTQYFVRVTTDVATTFNITVSEVELTPLALPGADTAQVVKDKEDKLYSFTVPNNNTWIFVNLIPDGGNTDLISLYVNEDTIADPDGCGIGYSSTTATNISRANITISPTRDSDLGSSCKFSKAGTYYVRVRTDSEEEQGYKLDVKLTPPETPAIPSGVQTVIGRNLPNYYHFNTSNNNTVFHIEVKPASDNESPFTVLVSENKIPDRQCTRLSSYPIRQWSKDLDAVTIFPNTYYNESVVNFTFHPSCGYVNSTYYIAVYAADYALAKYTIRAFQTAIEPIAIPSSEQTVNSEHPDYYQVNFTSTNVIRRIKVQSKNNTNAISVYVRQSGAPASCNYHYSCTNYDWTENCTVNFTPNPGCGYFNYSTYYILVQTATTVDQHYNISLEEEELVVEDVPAGEVTFTSESDKLYVFRPANNNSHLVAQINTDANNSASITLSWSFNNLPYSCGQYLESVTVPANTTRFLYRPPTPPCGYENHTVYLRVHANSAGDQKFTLSVAQSEQAYSPLPTGEVTVSYPIDTLYNYTTASNNTFFSITLEASEDNQSTRLWLYMAHTGIFHHKCYHDFDNYNIASCFADAGDSCTVYYAPICGYPNGTYTIRVNSTEPNGAPKKFKLTVREHNHTDLAPVLNDQVVNATIDKVYKLTTDATADSAVVLRTTTESGTVSVGYSKTKVFDKSCLATSTSRRVLTPTCRDDVAGADGYVNGTYYARVYGAGAEDKFNVSLTQFTSHQSVANSGTTTIKCDHFGVCFYEITLPDDGAVQVTVTNANPTYGQLSLVYDQNKWPVSGCGKAYTCAPGQINSGSCTFAWTKCMGNKIYLSLVSDSVGAGANAQAELEITVTRSNPTPLSVGYDTDNVYLNNDTTLAPILLELPPIVENPAVQSLRFTFSGFSSNNATVFLNVYTAESPYVCHAAPLRNYACHFTGSTGSRSTCVASVPACDLAVSGMKKLWALVHTTNLNVQLQILVDHSTLVSTSDIQYSTLHPYQRVQYSLPTPPVRGWNSVEQRYSGVATTLYDIECGENVEFGTGTSKRHLRCYEPTQSTIVASYDPATTYTAYDSSQSSEVTFTQTVPTCIQDEYSPATTLASDSWFDFVTSSSQSLTITIRRYTSGGSAFLFPVDDCNPIAYNISYYDVYTGYYHLTMRVSNLRAGRYHLNLLSTLSTSATISLDFSGGGAKACETGPVSDIVCAYVDKDNEDLYYCKPYIGNSYYSAYWATANPTSSNFISQAEIEALNLYSALYSTVDSVSKDCNSSLLKYACQHIFTKCGTDGEITPTCETQCRGAFEGCSSNRCLGALCQVYAYAGQCVGTLHGITVDAAPTAAVSALALVVALVVALVF